VADAAPHDLAVVPGDQSSWLDAQRAEAKALVREIRSQAVTRASSANSATTAAKILRRAGVSPAGARIQLSWRDFLRAHADSMGVGNWRQESP